ncbi:hypothetical protein [Cesiribacter andamanensis]|uniref:Uncharacterized protein n=1 Tax=Cesiribacter andamanensis AMV16 TaxID=1279009 RepID=M7N342_9BACT|nr:hypothetical protein [Cesiribacter andamanensis]EMR01702.1 hypothetical protein ADICEAN_03188 [Cesiribacter andamanensis AMV16]
MKTFTILLQTWVLVLLLGYSAANAQDCSMITGAGGDIFPDKRCAPVVATLQARFFSPASQPAIANFKIKVSWADGSAPEIFPASASLNADGTSWVYEIKNIKHTYPKGGEDCNYVVEAYPIINNTVECTSKFYRGNVTVWDTDDENGGELALSSFLLCMPR